MSYWRGALRAETARVIAALKVGFRLALLRKQDPVQLEVTPATFTIVVILGFAASFVISYFAVEPPREFDAFGIQSEGFYVLVVLLLCALIAAAHSRRDQLLSLGTLIFSAGLLAGSFTTLFQDHLLQYLLQYAVKPNTYIYWLVMAWFVLWWVAIWQGALTALAFGRPSMRLPSAVAAVAVLTVLPWIIQPMRLWDRDYAALYEQEQPTRQPLIAEEVFGRQAELLDQALTGIAPSPPDQPDLYFVAFGPYGGQDVFLKESLYSSRLFETRFGALDRTLTLVNNRQKLDELPLATVTNLERSLKWIGTQMDPAEDILFLFLTSHGSRDASLSIELEGITFKPLTAPVLASVLADSGIQWRVLVVSGCYSGSFLDALKDDHTLVISAARADRTSFGCSDGAEFTYFGRAYFEQALNQTQSFSEAFAIASKLLAEWETREGRERSEPQMVSGRLIEAHLERWQATLPATR